MKKCVIINSGEGNNKIYRELTDEQFNFLDSLFDEINNSPYGECYAPWISIQEELNTWSNGRFCNIYRN